MKALSKLERTILERIKGIPHLPLSLRRWLGENIWWIVIIGAILSGIAIIGLINTITRGIGLQSSSIASYYADTSYLPLVIFNASVALLFVAAEFVLMVVAITPLKLKEKKGWVLIFAVWLVGIIETVVGAFLTLNLLSFIGNIIFGGIWIAITGYLLFEMHGEFAHIERSQGIKEKKSAKKA